MADRDTQPDIVQTIASEIKSWLEPRLVRIERNQDVLVEELQTLNFRLSKLESLGMKARLTPRPERYVPEG